MKTNGRWLSSNEARTSMNRTSMKGKFKRLFCEKHCVGFTRRVGVYVGRL